MAYLDPAFFMVGNQLVQLLSTLSLHTLFLHNILHFYSSFNLTIVKQHEHSASMLPGMPIIFWLCSLLLVFTNPQHPFIPHRLGHREHVPNNNKNNLMKYLTAEIISYFLLLVFLCINDDCIRKILKTRALESVCMIFNFSCTTVSKRNSLIFLFLCARV